MYSTVTVVWALGFGGQGSDIIMLRQLSTTSSGWRLSDLMPAADASSPALSINASALFSPSAAPQAAGSLDPHASLGPTARSALFFYLHPPQPGTLGGDRAAAGRAIVDLSAGPLAHFHRRDLPKPLPPVAGGCFEDGVGIGVRMEPDRIACAGAYVYLFFCGPPEQECA